MSSSITSWYSKISTSSVQATLLALLAFFLPFERIPSLDAFGVTLRISQCIALALIFVSIPSIIRLYKQRPHLPKLLLPLFLLSYGISAAFAQDTRRALMVLVFTVFVALVASAIAATLKADYLPRIEKYLFAATAIVVAFGFYQYLGDVFGINPALTGLREIYTKEVFGFPRIQSTALEPLYYGSFLLIPYCLLLAKRLIQPQKVTKFHTILLVLITAQLLLTVSRGSIYSGIVATFILVVYLLLSKKSKIKTVAKTACLLIVGIVLGIAMTWVPTYFVNNTKVDGGDKTEKLIDQASNFNSQDDRRRNRTIAIEAIKDKPILGLGPGGFSDYAVEKFPLYESAKPVIVNNETLELAAEAGIIGFMLFIVFAGWTYLQVAAAYIKNRYTNSSLHYWAPAILAYTIALAIQYQTFSTLYIMHVWVVIGLLMAFGRMNQKANA